MSLLNQMLNDLDRRRAAAGVPALHREVRPLPPAPTGWWPAGWWLAALLAALLAAGGWWLVAGAGGGAPATAPGANALAGVMLPPLAVAAPGLPAESSAASAAAAVTPGGAGAPGESRDIVTASAGASLRLSESLSVPGGAASPAPTAPTAPVPLAVVAPSSGPGAGAAPPSVSSPAALAAAGQIDKRELAPDQREQAERLYRSAQTQLAQGREADAAATLRVVLRDLPDHLAARQLLIKLGIDRRAFAQAELDLEEGLRRLPRQTAWAMLLARLQVERGDAAAALAVLERHEAHANAAADYQAAMAAMLQRLNRPAEAAARFSRATQAEPTNGRWWLGLALARETQGEVAAAREAFRMALAAGNLSDDLRAFAEARLR